MPSSALILLMRLMLAILLVSGCAIWLAGCVPMALYHYASHDVSGEAAESDCQRMPETCQKEKGSIGHP